jgi:cytosine deaminase
MLVQGVRPWGGDLVDVWCDQGKIALIGADLDVPSGTEVIDGRGGIALPALADAHAHLDSTRLGLPFRSHTAEPGLAGLIDNDRRNWRSAEWPVAERATFTLGRTIASGATRVRSHAQVDSDSALERLHGVLAAREAHADRADVQVVAFPQCGIVRDRGTAELLDAALREGADLIGGLDPAGYDRDPVRHLDVIFGLAERHQCGVDIHLHDAGSLGRFQVELICERVAALAMQGHVTISHCFALPADGLVELLAAHDVAVTTVAPGTREPLPLAALRSAGVRVGLGQDGIRDYWSPYGDGDMLRRTWQLAYRNGFRSDAEIEMCVDVATNGGASVIGLGNGIAVGALADFFVVPGDSVAAAVMDCAPRTVVVHGGRVVAVDGELH